MYDVASLRPKPITPHNRTHLLRDCTGLETDDLCLGIVSEVDRTIRAEACDLASSLLRERLKEHHQHHIVSHQSFKRSWFGLGVCFIDFSVNPRDYVLDVSAHLVRKASTLHTSEDQIIKLSRRREAFLMAMHDFANEEAKYALAALKHPEYWMHETIEQVASILLYMHHHNHVDTTEHATVLKEHLALLSTIYDRYPSIMIYGVVTSEGQISNAGLLSFTPDLAPPRILYLPRG